MATIVFYLDDASSLTMPLEGDGVVTIGRHPDSVVVLPNASVSSQHATIEMRDGTFYVQDLKSSNGTRVNGAVIEEATLNDGDRVAFGDINSVFYAAEPPPPPPAPDAPIGPPAGAVVGGPPPKKKNNYIPPPPVHRQARRPTSGYPDTSGSGCVSGIVVTLLFIAAFIIGLGLRHYRETNGGNIITDTIEKLSKDIPKIKIEKKG